MKLKLNHFILKIGLAVSMAILLLTALSFVGSSANRTTSTVHWMGDLSEVDGASATLVRHNDGVSYTLHTNGLTSGDAVTNWWVVFNNPEHCTNPTAAIGSLCGFDDLDNADVAASILFAAGHVVGNGDHGNFAGSLADGDTGGALFGPGLTNTMGAEIHIIVRTHGPMIPELVSGQISSVDVACEINTCVDLQAAAFVP